VDKAAIEAHATVKASKEREYLWRAKQPEEKRLCCNPFDYPFASGRWWGNASSDLLDRLIEPA
jgi:hypothetical protein